MQPPPGYRLGMYRRRRACPPATARPTAPPVAERIAWAAVRLALDEGVSRAEVAAALQEVAAEVRAG